MLRGSSPNDRPVAGADDAIVDAADDADADADADRAACGSIEHAAPAASSPRSTRRREAESGASSMNESMSGGKLCMMKISNEGLGG
jgi:hypothetical protein